MRLILSIFLTVGYSLIFAQTKNENIVLNPSFEEHTECPKKRNPNNEIASLVQWKGHMTPDHFSTCSKNSVSVPENFAGTIMPADGESYVGIIVNYDKNSYTELLQQKLTEPLVKGQWYCCKFYCARASRARVATQTPQIMFDRKDKFGNEDRKSYNSFKSVKQFQSLAKQAVIPIGPVTEIETSSWALIGGVYQAYGDETSIYIGRYNLAEDEYTFVNDNEVAKLNNAYYFIDHISIVAVADTADCACDTKNRIAVPISEPEGEAHIIVETKESIPEAEQSVVLKNVLFHTDESEFLPESKIDLDYLLDLLSDSPDISILITGHTDNTGQEKENIRLSTERAVAVKNFLIQQGITPNRIQCRGLGSAVPILNNSTAEGRKKNRRVEFKIISE